VENHSGRSNFQNGLFWPTHPFHRGQKQGGLVEGANLAVEYRWGEDHVDRLPALAADLVRRKVKVIASLDSTQAC
jgi:hypothetical protein